MTFFQGWMLGGTRFGNDTWINKWCKFEMDAVEYYEGSHMRTKVTVKGIYPSKIHVFQHNLRII